MSSRGSVTGNPNTLTVPDEGFSRPEISRRIVDLPQPEGPMIETNSVRRTSRSISQSAVTVDRTSERNVWVTFLISPAAGPVSQGVVSAVSGDSGCARIDSGADAIRPAPVERLFMFAMSARGRSTAIKFAAFQLHKI